MCYTNPLFSSHLGYDFPRSPEELTPKRKFLPAVSTSLALAAGIGLMETVALIFGSGTLMDMIGIPIVSKNFHFFPFSETLASMTWHPVGYPLSQYFFFYLRDEMYQVNIVLHQLNYPKTVVL